MALLVLLIGVRWLRYAAPGIDHVLGEIMIFDQQAFLWPWAYTTLDARVLIVALAVFVAGVHRRLPGWLVVRRADRWGLTPLAVCVLFGLMLWFHYLFDLNPTIAFACAISCVLLLLAETGRTSRKLFLALSACFLVGMVVRAHDVVDRITLLAWALFLGTTWAIRAHVDRRDLGLVRIAAIIPANLLAASLPLFLPVHGGTLFGKGLAYSFCEIPARAALYAAVPGCGSVDASYERCRDGSIVEYDVKTMQASARYTFFSPDFHGRLEQLLCLDDEVQVAVQDLTYRGRNVVSGVLAFPPDNPSKFGVLTADRGIGATIAYDAAHDAVFYSGEFDNPLVRYDRRTRAFDDDFAPEFARRWYEPISLQANIGSLAVSTACIHPRRNRLYVTEWMQGRYVYALDLTTLRVVARYDVGSGGALGVTVDPDRERLFVSSLWGVEVIDLETDRIVDRKRTGLGNRPAVLDARRNRIYVSSMVEGKIRIFDRDTLELIGQVPIGFGSRYPLLTTDGRYLVASSLTAHYYWNADSLVPEQASTPR
ncbi:MAG TPA: hypothetical protein VKU61_04560 [Candidatus Binatia bacterium]|nr:hypothetical protein [Candidatus Binatia bacterium]